MPVRPFCREQDWLFPPSLEELIPRDHPVRFVAAFVDGIGRTGLAELGIDVEGDELGAPSYHPLVMLCVWVYGFMTGVRSTRKLEAACWEQLPYLWLTGMQHPDHNTLWRFYEAHRQGMKKLLKRTVKTAVRMGLVDLAVQAVDGSKIAGNAARDRSLDGKGLEKLLERTGKAIAELEAQNKAEGELAAPKLPERLAEAEALREQVRAALEKVRGEGGPKEVNLTDPEARLVKSRQGIVAGYNAQAVVSPLDPEVAQGTGLLITAAEVVDDPDDHAQLMPMLEEARGMTGQVAGVSMADGGYHSGANLEACAEEGITILMPESQDRALENPYHKDGFQYDVARDSYSCPQGQELRFSGIKRRADRPEMRVYRASASVCVACPAFGQCTKDKHQGRALEIGPHEGVLRSHRALMATEEAKGAYRHRKELVEPTFGILKETQGARRFLLRGLEKVRAEWALLAASFNLKTLWRVWRRRPSGERWELAGATSP